jgi:YidC/Oxa1 family membrane protein insertase
LEDKRNIILAVILSAFILFGWGALTDSYFPEPVKPKPRASAPANATAINVPVSGEAPASAIANGGPATTQTTTGQPAMVQSIADALKGTARVAIETPKLKGSINLEGARVDDLLLLAHRTEVAKNSPPVRLFAPSNTKKGYYARFGWTGAAGMELPNEKTIWTPSAGKLTPSTPVTLSWNNAAGQTFQIIYSIDKDYLITAKQRFVNNSSAPAQISGYGLIKRTGKSTDIDTWNIHVGPMGVFNGTAVYDVDYANLDGEAPGFFSNLFGTSAKAGTNSFTTTGGWVGFTDMYWLAALAPDSKLQFKAEMAADKGNYQTNVLPVKSTNVAAGGTHEQTTRLFAGAKEVEVLSTYADKQGIAYLDYAIDWGWFWFIAIPFFKILHWLFGVFGNFGVAIIGLTLIVRAFMFPIAQKGFASMAQMRAIQPKLKSVQEKYKDDKPKLQQEMMKLYKEEKVNPMGGCLPLLLQIPVFFALYKLLMLTIEMRHQPFTLWLKDLSAPDPSAHIVWDALGTGITLPAFLAIGVLPILLGVTMWLMQKLNPQPTDDVQKTVLGIMPWFLMFIMAPFAAGLQLYWVVSNVVSILQQKWLYSRHPQLKEQMAQDAAKKLAEKAKA